MICILSQINYCFFKSIDCVTDKAVSIFSGIITENNSCRQSCCSIPDCNCISVNTFYMVQSILIIFISIGTHIEFCFSTCTVKSGDNIRIDVTASSGNSHKGIITKNNIFEINFTRTRYIYSSGIDLFN